MLNLPMELVKEIQTIAAKYPSVQKVVLFGSRARGDNRSNSDIDLAVWADEDFKGRGAFSFDIDDIRTLLKIDLAIIQPHTDQDFLANIQKDGVLLYERLPE